MPKTEDAFALRDFDAEQILQRKFFLSKLKLPLLVDTDAENLDSLFNVAAISHLGTVEMRQRLIKAQRLKAVTADYTSRLLEHDLKIERFTRNSKTRDRAAVLQQCYRIAIELLGGLQRKINRLISEGEKAVAKVFCKELGERIKESRESLGLTRQDVSFLLGFSLNTIAQYERGEREPSPYTLRRLSEILKRSPNWLLGFAV